MSKKNTPARHDPALSLVMAERRLTVASKKHARALDAVSDDTTDCALIALAGAERSLFDAAIGYADASRAQGAQG